MGDVLESWKHCRSRKRKARGVKVQVCCVCSVCTVYRGPSQQDINGLVDDRVGRARRKRKVAKVC